MSCLRFSTEISKACRDAQPGVTELFIADYTDIASFSVIADGTTLSGLTCSGTTGQMDVFWRVKLNKQVGAFIDMPTINIMNGVAVSKPKVSGAIQGLSASTIGFYEQLMSSDVVVVAKTINGDLFIIGAHNGLSMSAGGLGTEAAVDGKIGVTTFELDGIEPKPFYIVPASLNFEATYVA